VSCTVHQLQGLPAVEVCTVPDASYYSDCDSLERSRRHFEADWCDMNYSPFTAIGVYCSFRPGNHSWNKNPH